MKQNNNIKYCTVYDTVQYSEQYCTVQQSTVFYSTAVYSIVQYSSVQYCTVPVCGQGRGNGRLGQGLANPEKK